MFKRIHQVFISQIATLEDVFDYLFNLGAEKFLSEKKRNIYMNYLKNGIQSILN